MGSVDWTSGNPEPKTQKCLQQSWAYAVIGLVECYDFIMTSIFNDLSEQQLLDCSQCMISSTSDVIECAINYIIKNGLVTVPNYPGCCCGIDKNKLCETKIKSIVTYNRPSFELICDKISTCPIIAQINLYEDFCDYKTGIYNHQYGKCITNKYYVLLVGYNVNDKFIIAKNSMGPSFGWNGYIKISADSCIITKIYVPKCD